MMKRNIYKGEFKENETNVQGTKTAIMETSIQGNGIDVFRLQHC